MELVMKQFSMVRKFILVFGDFSAMILALFLSLWVRYGVIDTDRFNNHLNIFYLVFLLWIVVLYLSNLYKLNLLLKIDRLIINLSQAVFISTLVTILYFYLLPSLRITPKTILIFYALFTFILIFIWRLFYLKINNLSNLKNHVIIIGNDSFSKILAQEIEGNQNWGYTLVKIINYSNEKEINYKTIPYNQKQFVNLITQEDINLIAVQFDKIHNHDEILQRLSLVIERGIDVIDSNIFYEQLTSKVPVNQLNQIWFLYNLEESEKILYEHIKRLIDIILSALGCVFIVIFIILVPILMLITNDKGGIFYIQKRVGFRGKIFKIYKFRTMVINKEVSWTTDNDQRITILGKLLRKLRIDELPQVINILRGEMSFIGPRPEQPTIVKSLNTKIPFYSRRHIIRPGLTGWAQTQFRYGASIQDALEKLQYDLYYIKNRSFFLDITIILKTLTIILGFKGK
ncbi:MAG: Exopolysaccharide biosynthesis polyprenyl glycosylphosphotransferase [uncultured bacterium]|nr:MAG: Exopolysaccharide biosynthesis polyprenyl glycosylphosphotransferase [uncultured bacterium]